MRPVPGNEKPPASVSLPPFARRPWAGSPRRPTTKVLAKVNGWRSPIRISALADGVGAAACRNWTRPRARTTRRCSIDLQIVALAAEDKGDNTDDFKDGVAFTRKRLMMDSLLATEDRKAATTDEAMKRS